MAQPSDPAIWPPGSNLLQTVDAYQGAINRYDDLLSVQPDLYEIWTYRGYALERLEQFQEAIAIIRHGMAKGSCWQNWDDTRKPFLSWIGQ